MSDDRIKLSSRLAKRLGMKLEDVDKVEARANELIYRKTFTRLDCVGSDQGKASIETLHKTFSV